MARGLQPRERRVLAVGAALLVVLLGYALVWSPYREAVARLRADVTEGRELLAWMEGAAVEVARLRGREESGRSPRGSLLARVDGAARRHGLGDAVRRVRPDGDGRVRVWLEGAAFDPLMGWLGDLVAGGGLQVQELVVDRSDGPGRVDARVVLAGG